jgi:thymidylate synthase
MNEDEKRYLDLLNTIILTGASKKDRTNTGTISIFGSNLKFSLENDIVPMLTTKRMFTRGVIEELLFFLRGQTDSKILEDKGVNIWKGNTSREYLDEKGLNHLPEGDMGKGYGFQWRRFNEQIIDAGTLAGDYPNPIILPGIDQVSQVLEMLKSSPDDRRMIISAWNPSQLHEMALPPCHILCQFYVSDGKLSAQWYQRSVDSFLGLPFNILSYAILTKIMAKAAGLKPKELIFVGGDTHIYSNHIDQVKLQISRTPFDFPTMKIEKNISSIEDIENLKFEDFIIENYNCYPSIKADMAI